MLIETLSIEPWQWPLATLGAFMVGVSKTGIAGLSILFIALFAVIFPSTKQASGLVLPLLILGDMIAVLSYRRHMQWHFLGRLFPWTAVGVVIGFFALAEISDAVARTLVGGIILSMSVGNYWLRFRAVSAETQQALTHWGAAAVIGIAAGFTTLVANAAGPLLAIYLIAMRLPKIEFVGTAAVFFALLNVFKVPFMVKLGLVTAQSVEFNLLLAPAVCVGALVGRRLMTRINQKLFEEMALALSAIAGLILLL
jgi:uncharacterized membrane protein YfcA